MSAGQYNITIEPGATFLLPISYTFNGIPVDLSGEVITAIIQRAPGMDPSLVLSTTNGGILATPILGQFTMYATAGQTTTLNDLPFPVGGVWVLQTQTAAATPIINHLLRGKVLVHREI